MSFYTIGDTKTDNNSFFSNLVTFNTFMKKTELFYQSIESNIHLTLLNEDKLVVCIDNN